MLNFSRLAHDLRWIAIDTLGHNKGCQATVVSTVETLPVTARTNTYRVFGPPFGPRSAAPQA
jgi:hypothetical protein